MELSNCITVEDSDCEEICEEICLEIPVIPKNNAKTVEISNILNTLSAAKPGEFISVNVDDDNFLDDSVIETTPSEEFLCEATGRLINSKSPKEIVEEIPEDVPPTQLEDVVPYQVPTQLEPAVENDFALSVKSSVINLNTEKPAKLGSRRKTAHNAKSCEDVTFESIVLSETEEPPTKKADINVSDVVNPNEDLMKKVAFLRVCVNYMMLSLGKPAIEFGDNVTLEWMMNTYKSNTK